MNVLDEVSDEQGESLGLWYTCFPSVRPCDPKKKFMWIILIYYKNCKKLRVEKFCYCSTTILPCVYNIVQDVRPTEKQVGILRLYVKVQHFILYSSTILFL